MRNGEAEKALEEGGIKVTNRVYRCSECGFTRYGVQCVELDGALYYSHQCNSVIAHKSFSDTRMIKCLDCEHRDGGICKLSGEEIRNVVRIATEDCPDDQWLAVDAKCPKCDRQLCDPTGVTKCNRCDWGRPKQKTDLPTVDRSYAAAPVFVTAADEQFAAGLYMLAWSLLRNNHCKLWVADLGLNRFGNVYRQLQSWGVEFFDPEIGIFPVPGWQLHNKPFIIRQALQRHSKVTWIDADIYAGDLSGLSDIDMPHPLMPNHKGLMNQEFLFRNKDAYYDTMSLPKMHWETNESPCTCLVTVDGSRSRDMRFVEDWCSASEAAWTTGAIYHASYYDQGIAQDIIDFPMIDGAQWNYIDMMSAINREKKRAFGPLEMVRQINKIDGVSVFHFAGKWKPFKEWAADKMNWGNPLADGSRVNDGCLIKSPLK